MLKPKRRWNLFRRKTVKENGDTTGATFVAVAIKNPTDPERVWEGEFMIDTGAVDSLVPRQHLESMGLVPEGQRVYGLADGSELRFDIAVARIGFMGEVVGGTVIFGPENAEPLLGVTALESVGVEVDPHNATLNKLPARRLRDSRPRF